MRRTCNLILAVVAGVLRVAVVSSEHIAAQAVEKANPKALPSGR